MNGMQIRRIQAVCMHFTYVTVDRIRMGRFHRNNYASLITFGGVASVSCLQNKNEKSQSR